MRHYYRCTDCLGIFTLEQKLPVVSTGDIYKETYGTCSACGGDIEYMGQVEGTRLTKTKAAVPCDSRCVFARGPSCDCQCRGENHGSGLVVTYTVDAGGIPRISQNNPDMLRDLADKYRELLRQVEYAFQRRYSHVRSMRLAGRYLLSNEWDLCVESSRVRRRIFKAMSMRSHKGRNAALEKIKKEISNA